MTFDLQLWSTINRKLQRSWLPNEVFHQNAVFTCLGQLQLFFGDVELLIWVERDSDVWIFHELVSALHCIWIEYYVSQKVKRTFITDGMFSSSQEVLRFKCKFPWRVRGQSANSVRTSTLNHLISLVLSQHITEHLTARRFNRIILGITEMISCFCQQADECTGVWDPTAVKTASVIYKTRLHRRDNTTDIHIKVKYKQQ